MNPINERLFTTLDSSPNMSQKLLAASVGINAATVSAWRTRDSLPSADLILPICDYLGITPEFLLGGRQNESWLSDDERRFLQSYNKISDKNKRVLEAFMNGLLAAEENN